MADDYSPDRYTAGALRAGASLTGEVETGGDVDWIKVRLQAGKTYRIDLEGVPTRAGTLDDPKLLGVHDYRTRLLPDTGDDDGGIGYNSRLFFSADRYGDYFIAVGARGHRTGTYKLLVEEVSTDDYPDGRFGGLGIEAPARGEIELPGDRDRFEVRLEAGRTYRIDIDGSPVAARQMDGRLYALRDAEDNLVTAITRDGDTRLYVRPSAEGIYTIEAGSASDSVRNTGRYSLSVAGRHPCRRSHVRRRQRGGRRRLNRRRGRKTGRQRLVRPHPRCRRAVPGGGAGPRDRPGHARRSAPVRHLRGQRRRRPRTAGRRQRR